MTSATVPVNPTKPRSHEKIGYLSQSDLFRDLLPDENRGARGEPRHDDVPPLPHLL